MIFPKENGEFYFPIADGRIKTLWRRSGPENIHFGAAIDQFKEMVTLTFLENQKGPLPQPHDSLPDVGESDK